jgi:carbohydrate-binding DOMON domain-containing protein
MIRMRIAMAVTAALCTTVAAAQEVVFKDPVGDDDGPGKYVYPTDPVYKKGSFDLTELKVTEKDGKVTFAVSVNSDLEDPWSMPAPANFSVQMAIIHVQTGKGGFTKGIPGTNVVFAPEDAWNKVVILSPQPAGRVRAEAKQKAKDLLAGIVAPDEVTGKGRTISGTVDKKLLGEGDITKWGYQVLMQSNEGFPDKTDLLTRKVNEFEGQHRFGGGTDFDCDPHVMDVLAGKGVGDKSEIDEQHKMLSYECNPDGTPKRTATLRMVRK